MADANEHFEGGAHYQGRRPQTILDPVQEYGGQAGQGKMERGRRRERETYRARGRAGESARESERGESWYWEEGGKMDKTTKKGDSRKHAKTTKGDNKIYVWIERK
jgi:hypothetical protein